MTSLPPEVPKRLRDIPDVVSAYNICLEYEKSLQLAIDNGDDVGNKQIYIRILGYLIHYVPTAQGLESVVKEISSYAEDDSALLNLGEMYFNHYIRQFRANKGRTPAPSNHASRPSFDNIVDMISDTLGDAPRSHANAKHNALIRDGYRCVVSGKYDHKLIMQNLALRRLAIESGKALSMTQCTHILSESTNVNIAPGSDKRTYAATMWTILKRFGYESLAEELKGPKVHRLENVMTLDFSVHSMFDQLEIWFTATNEVNKYKFEGISPIHSLGYPQHVTFTTPDQDKLPVPSPAYLAIHAACAKVAHLSGAREYIDKLYQEMEESQTLAPDGSSASMLEHAIFELQARV